MDEFPLDISLAYVFARLELAHNMALYCGRTKLHKVASKLAKQTVKRHHMTRKEFNEKYRVVYGDYLKDATRNLLKNAETFEISFSRENKHI